MYLSLHIYFCIHVYQFILHVQTTCIIKIKIVLFKYMCKCVKYIYGTDYERGKNISKLFNQTTVNIYTRSFSGGKHAIQNICP